MGRASGAIALLCVLCAALVSPLRAAEGGAGRSWADSVPHLVTNEHEIVNARRSFDGLSISNPRAAFNYVLASLPARVKVYPTENYYYFRFIHDAVPYAGNIRLDAVDRDLGTLHFTYFRSPQPWMGRSAVTHLELNSSSGVVVEKLDRFIYRVTNDTVSVVFELNDMSGIRPPPAALLPDERYLGPVFDDSGVRFFLVFGSRAKVFHYLLDETPPIGDRFAPTGVSDRIQVSMRTGFAFYRDHRAPRKILVGVYADNESLNNYFDGPFDQLPDNFIEGNKLRDAILAVEPGLAGRIGRLGHFHGETTRYLIAPYLRYRALADLASVEQCATANAKRSSDSYAACFAAGRIDSGQ